MKSTLTKSALRVIFGSVAALMLAAIMAVPAFAHTTQFFPGFGSSSNIYTGGNVLGGGGFGSNIYTGGNVLG